MLCAESFVFPQRSVPNLRIDGEKAKSPKGALPPVGQGGQVGQADKSDRADKAERMSGSAVQGKQLQRFPHAYSVQVV